MAKRSVSKNFHAGTNHLVLLQWVGLQLAGTPILDKKICITINLDPDKKETMIPEGPKIPKEYHKNRR